MDQNVPCPGCGTGVPLPEERRPATFPFCSARCRVLDLGAWATDRYAIAGRAGANPDDAGQDGDADQDDETR